MIVLSLSFFLKTYFSVFDFFLDCDKTVFALSLNINKNVEKKTKQKNMNAFLTKQKLCFKFSESRQTITDLSLLFTKIMLICYIFKMQ